MSVANFQCYKVFDILGSFAIRSIMYVLIVLIRIHVYMYLFDVQRICALNVQYMCAYSLHPSYITRFATRLLHMILN